MKRIGLALSLLALLGLVTLGSIQTGLDTSILQYSSTGVDVSTGMEITVADTSAFIWSVGFGHCYAGQSRDFAINAAYPSTANGTTYWVTNIPFHKYNGTVVIDQIVAGYSTVGSSDDFDWSIVKTDGDGTISTVASKASVGASSTGYVDENLITSDITTATGISYTMICVQTGVDAKEDTKLFTFTFYAHLE